MKERLEDRYAVPVCSQREEMLSLIAVAELACHARHGVITEDVAELDRVAAGLAELLPIYHVNARREYELVTRAHLVAGRIIGGGSQLELPPGESLPRLRGLAVRADDYYNAKAAITGKPVPAATAAIARRGQRRGSGLRASLQAPGAGARRCQSVTRW